MSKQRYLSLVLLLAGPASVQAQRAKNVVLFIGDGVGVSSLSAASIYGYNQPQGLYAQSLSRLALAETTTVSTWIPDGAASATAMATGVKTNNGIVSQSAAAVQGERDGQNLKTILEYAEERGLSTGVISNDYPTGVASALVSAFYAHHNDRMKSAAILSQIFTQSYGDGVDLVIGTGKERIFQQAKEEGRDLVTGIKSHGYAYTESLDQLTGLDPKVQRIFMLTDDIDFSIQRATQQAVARLSQNPKGYFLVVFSECHLKDAKKDLERIVELDGAFRNVDEAHKSDTLTLFTADHGFFLLTRGEHLVENRKSANGRDVLKLISLEDEHTGDAVPLMASGPGSERVQGFVSNTAVFNIMLSAYGWEN